jgi:hypothetical protein
MTKSEQAAVVRLVRHMKQLQAQVAKPKRSDATEEEVKTLIELLWEWHPYPRYELPSKHVIEKLVGLMRGCEDREYCYISRGETAAVIRKMAENFDSGSCVILSEGWRNMSDVELYDKGKWNYKPTPLVDLLFNLHANPQMFNRNGDRNY